MKKILFGLSLLACAAGASAASYPVCISFAPAGYCDAMQYDSKKAATWVSYDCAGSAGEQTKAKYKKKAATTFCDGTAGCDPAATYGWDSFSWDFDLKASTGTLKGMSGGVEYILQQDMPIAVTSGACTVVEGGVSSLAR
jgi:hypothetical protein